MTDQPYIPRAPYECLICGSTTHHEIAICRECVAEHPNHTFAPCAEPSCPAKYHVFDYKEGKCLG